MDVNKETVTDADVGVSADTKMYTETVFLMPLYMQLRCQCVAVESGVEATN